MDNKKLKDTYNKIAEDWFKDHKVDDWWVEGTDKFVNFLKPNDLVLDVGCGAGVKSRYLISKGLRVIGIDFSEKMVEVAKREVPGVDFCVMDVAEADNLKESFDGIFAQAVLLHIPKKEIAAIISGLKDKLKEGGYLYIAVKEVKDAEEKIEKENDYGYDYERFFSYFHLSEIKKYLTDLNMKVCYENVLSSGKTNWIQVVAKK